MRAMGKRSISSFLTVLLNVGWYGTALALVLMLSLAVASPFVVDVSGWEMDIPVSFTVETGVTAASLGIEDARIRDARGSLIFPPLGGAFLAAPAAAVTLVLAFVLLLLGQLRAVFRTLRDGQPFAPANAARIRWIGCLVIAGELVRAALVLLANHFALTHFAADGLRFDARPDLNVLAIVHGLIILVIAEVFRAGTRLDEEQSLTV